MSFSTRVAVGAPAELVWRTLTDVTRWPEFTPTVTSVRLLDDEPFGVGARARVEQPGMPPLDWLVTALTPGRSFVWETVAAGVTITGGHVVETGAGGGTEVVLSITRSGLLAPVLALLTGARTRRYVRTEAVSLKRRCEEQHRGRPE
ncbi:SRPBCC family protein [Actinomadura sp. ATCC 31491]|uniref:SRPBCC family protein n=1 Tax=Actinomadura luzonensis TaxID=2805427 RepID=A0ABT0FWV9_9ACTN|nr:SRPBCC family protein [Actinomadura luzonensis]MCK2216836.1 SRPBCC family protein [Actinomadura luzonensis]